MCMLVGFSYLVFCEQNTYRSRKASNYAFLTTTRKDSNSLSINKTKGML